MSKSGADKLGELIHSIGINEEAWVGYLDEEDHDVYEIKDINELSGAQLIDLGEHCVIYSIMPTISEGEGKIIISLRYPK